jgi:hypothetical protein
VANIRGYPASYRPTWRLTEVAAIDGLGWVMRNNGFRLDEDFGMMHFYDLDLSLQFIEAGFRVYVAGVEIEHLSEDERESTRSREDYLARVGGSDAEGSRTSAAPTTGSTISSDRSASRMPTSKSSAGIPSTSSTMWAVKRLR